MKLKILLFFAILSGAIPTYIVQNKHNFYHRLSDHFDPLAYDLKFSFNSDSTEILGQVSIEIRCLQSTSKISLHSDPNYIQIQHGIVTDKNKNTTTSFPEVVVDQLYHTITYKKRGFKFRRNRIYTLTIWFKAEYGYGNKGLIYTNDKKYGRWIHTLFETSYARQLFPCFDEPKFRSAFKLQLWLYAEYAKPSYTALSNTNGIPYKFNENLTIWTFNDTPSLPTYLFTIAIGKFDHYCCSSELDMDQNICIWKLVNVENHLWYNVADKVCDQASIFQANTENYVGINTGARLHFLIIPTYLNGMENFGLLIVSERLWPRENNKYSYIAFEKTLKHEMAHQFFGNLVTMEWWNDIWLSESLTCFLALPKLHQHRYDMDLSEDSIIDKRWAEKIPRIVYVKGAAVLSMLENVIEPSNMRLLLQVYLSRYYFQSASTKNFVEILKQVTRDFREEAPEFLMSWLTQGSYPLVFINYDQNNQQFILSQTPKVGDISRRWLIPIWIDCAGGTVNETLYWIPKHSDLVIKLDEVTKTNQTAAITFNNNRIVYYGIVYKYVTE